MRQNRGETVRISTDIVGLESMEGRGLEELWVVRCGKYVKEAWGKHQDGGGDSLVPALFDMEVHGVRRAQQLPSGDFFH